MSTCARTALLTASKIVAEIPKNPKGCGLFVVLCPACSDFHLIAYSEQEHVYLDAQFTRDEMQTLLSALRKTLEN